MIRPRRSSVFVTLALLASLWTFGAPPAGANSHTTCRIVVTDLGPTLKIVYTVLSPTPRRRYAVRITVEGEQVFRDRLRTGDDRRLRIRLDVDDEPGNELIQGRARDLSSGSLCLATVRAPGA